MEEKKDKVEMKTLTPEEAEKLGPQEIVICNARTLVHSDLKTATEYINKSIEYMQGLIKKDEEADKDFREDANALIGIQLQLASISLAAEYWLKKIKTNKIKVYGADEMPKA